MRPHIPVTRRLMLAAAVWAAAGSALGQTVSAGRLVTHAAMTSDGLQPRDVFVWLPHGYDESRQRYPVLYMHDGQNLFSDEVAGFGVEWGVDERMSALAAARAIAPHIVVGVANTPARRREYLPEGLLRYLPEVIRQQIESSVEGVSSSAAYIRFLADELKPRIDAAYRTRPGRRHTSVMGSSMGGLISLEATIVRPDVFSSAGCVSTHWPLRFAPFADEAALLAWQRTIMAGIGQYLRARLPAPGQHKFYFDFGGLGLDAYYAPYQAAADAAFFARGYREGRDYASHAFAEADHNERSWRERLELPLTTLFGGV